jgi:pSer/pThr/pTyr-binding forkhead associated (FHA) protein
MASVRVRFEQNPITEYEILRGGTLTIGRAKSNDVVIENLGVSNHHAKIDSVDERFLLSDLKSKNGTFVNEELITSHWLNQGDVIVIGKHTLFFMDSRDLAGNGTGERSSDKTMVMDTTRQQNLLAKAFSKEEPEEIKRTPVGTLSFLAGRNGELRLTEKLVKMGKEPICEIRLKGLFMGKTAATISNRPSGFYLSYVSGLSKPKVNGKKVKTSVKLEEFDIIELGHLRMQFVYKFSYAK